MAAHERHDALIRKCIKKRPAGSLAATVGDARGIVERATVSHDYETLRVFLEAGFPADATVGVNSTLFPSELGLPLGKIISAPLLLMAFYPAARPTLLMNECETRGNQVNVIRLLLIHGASIDQTVKRGFSVFDSMLAVKPEKTNSLRYAVLRLLLHRDLLRPSHFVKLVTSYATGYPRCDDDDLVILMQLAALGKVTGRHFESWARGGRGVEYFPWEYFGLALLKSWELTKTIFGAVADGIESYDSKRMIAGLIAKAIVWQCNYGPKPGYTSCSVHNLLGLCVAIDHTMPQQRYEIYLGNQEVEQHRLFEWVVLYVTRRLRTSFGPITLDCLREFFSLVRDGNRNLFVPAFVASHCGADVMRKLNILYDCVEWGDRPEIMYREQRIIAERLFSLALQWELHPDRQYNGSNKTTRKSLRALWTADIITKRDNPSGVQLPVEIISRISMFFLIGTFGFAMHLICPRVQM